MHEWKGGSEIKWKGSEYICGWFRSRKRRGEGGLKKSWESFSKKNETAKKSSRSAGYNKTASTFRG